jgi:Fur family ferric uptake transcriptional regulator
MSGARSDTVTELHDRLNEYMRRHGLRSTAQRRLVTDVFFHAEGHLSIEELLEKVRAEDSKVGYATVYRTLKLLKDSGIASERHFGDGVSRYEVHHGGDHHDHLICEECGEIVEFEDDEIERLQEVLVAKKGFVLTRHRHELFGICREVADGKPCVRRKRSTDRVTPPNPARD